VWGENAGRWLEDYARILLTFSFEEKDAEGLSEIRFFFQSSRMNGSHGGVPFLGMRRRALLERA
jgi:hypothetical protein